MGDLDDAELPKIVVMLAAALELAHEADQTLLGAKIDEALECARDALASAV